MFMEKKMRDKILLLFLGIFVWKWGIVRTTKKIKAEQEHNKDSSHIRSTIYFFQTEETLPYQDGLYSKYKKSTRLQGLLAKMYSGRQLNMITIGGSNSAGGGLEKSSQLFYNLITDWWNNNIYKMTGSKLTSHKMAIGGTSSDFFAFCFQNYLPKEPVDIVLVELSVNDYGYKYGEAAKPMELLTRRLLSLPSKPLVMYVHFLNKKNANCSNMEDLGLNQLGKHYGVISLSLRVFVCPLNASGIRQKMRTDPDMFSTDGTSHVGFRAHALIASMAVKYFNMSLYDHFNTSDDSFVAKDKQPPLVDPLFLESSFSDFELNHALCLSYLTPNWRILLKQTLSAQVIQSLGFEFVPPRDSIRQFAPHGAKRTDASGGWSSLLGNSFLKVQFEIPMRGSVSTTWFRSVVVLLQNVRALASIKMWLNGDLSSALNINSYRKCNDTSLRSILYPLPTNTSSGNHTLCISSESRGRVVFSGLIIGFPGYHGYEGYKPLDVKYSVWSLKEYLKWRC